MSFINIQRRTFYCKDPAVIFDPHICSNIIPEPHIYPVRYFWFVLANSFAFPEIDLSLSISVILALCAIVSPILVAIINNIHHTKIRKLEIQQDQYRNTILHQRDVFENYLKHAGRCIYFADSTALKDYGEFYFAALSYAPAELRGDMITANQLMLQDEWEEATPIIESIATKIHRNPHIM